MFGRIWDRYYIFITKNTLKPRFFFACGELNIKLMHSLQYSLNNCNRFCFKVSSRKWGTSSNDFVYLSKYELWNNFLPLPLTEKTCYPSVINVTVPNEKCLFQIKLLLGPRNRKLAAPPLVIGNPIVVSTMKVSETFWKESQTFNQWELIRPWSLGRVSNLSSPKRSEKNCALIFMHA